MTTLSLFIVLWGTAATRVKFDWAKDRVLIARGMLFESFRLASVERVELVNNDAPEKSQLDLIVAGWRVPLLATLGLEDREDRLGCLYTPGRRLAPLLRAKSY